MADDPFLDGVPDLAQFCVAMGPAGELCVRFPGGTKLCATVGLEFGDLAQITRSLFAGINTALAPLSPFFDMIDVLKAVLDCIQGIPDLIGPPPDPQKIINCIPTLIQKLERLLALLPPYSIPIMVKDICAALATFLSGTKREIESFLAQQRRILQSATAAIAPGNVALKVVVDCATGNLDVSISNLNAAGGPLNRLIGDINALCQLVGIPGLPIVPDLTGDVEAALNKLDPIIVILSTIAATIPG